METSRDIWVFAYGSLLWRPGFAWREARPALLRGHHRSLCVLSWHWRGTPEKPGLVVGLDRGGSCLGRAYRVGEDEAGEVIAALDARELVSEIYLPRWLPVETREGRVSAYAYVVRRNHEQYAGRLADAEAARLVVQGRGEGGAALDYLRETVSELDRLGLPAGPLHRVLALAEAEATSPSRDPGGKASPAG